MTNARTKIKTMIENLTKTSSGLYTNGMISGLEIALELIEYEKPPLVKHTTVNQFLRPTDGLWVTTTGELVNLVPNYDTYDPWMYEYMPHMLSNTPIKFDGDSLTSECGTVTLERLATPEEKLKYYSEDD